MRLPVQRCNPVDIIVLCTSIRDVTATQIDNPNLSVHKKLWTLLFNYFPLVRIQNNNF